MVVVVAIVVPLVVLIIIVAATLVWCRSKGGKKTARQPATEGQGTASPEHESSTAQDSMKPNTTSGEMRSKAQSAGGLTGRNSNRKSPVPMADTTPTKTARPTRRRWGDDEDQESNAPVVVLFDTSIDDETRGSPDEHVAGFA